MGDFGGVDSLLESAVQELIELSSMFPTQHSPERISINTVIDQVSTARHILNESGGDRNV